MKHPIDIAVMFTAIWLLLSIGLDILTPKELTAYLIAIAIGPAIIITGSLYYLQIPRMDFALIFVALWLLSAEAIVWISPKPLPAFLVWLALVPPLSIGAILHWQRSGRRSARHLLRRG